MATREEVNGNDLVNEVLLEDRLVEIWPDYPCLYDARSTDFKNRDMRQQAFEEMAKKLSQTGTYIETRAIYLIHLVISIIFMTSFTFFHFGPIAGQCDMYNDIL